ncbi:SWR1-complex protein 4 [Nannizzia gypsea CBS 118893]|uniref:SWR1-complex protein 4 n=1 Tax=Arthroderma gypseum (strain ATCC MYA-4604 / CBS 118893) TaxID=535722 RepID=E5R2Z7_ARTGP|nr:SWR1-complex protein 4 [Nannizzia gypsea CBS 118893]EFQ98701.1 SWR1-complex protein 4 [Nannizzia gypsea CBS 118893]
MAAADVRDMLDLPADGQPRPAKKQKVVEKRPEGITRELYALLGERAPPIALNENKYKGRRKWMSKLKVRPWAVTPFKNAARNDDLVLNHWQRKPVARNPPPNAGSGQENATDKAVEDTSIENEETSAFAKYNVKAQHPRRYTSEEYDKLLKSDIWSREETDYLMDLVEEFDLRWIIIADRYEYSPNIGTAADGSSSTALVAPTKRRTMEEMKSRYYNIAAHMLAIEHPLSEMSEAEFEIHEKMMKFNPERERTRKELANTQLNRTKEEVTEEALLLEELKRIVANESQFIDERKELYARLEAPVSTGNTAMYQTSQGLSQLLQSLLQADRNKKRRPLLGPDTGVSSPVGNAPSGGPSARESRPETPAPTPTAPTNNKKGASANAAAQPTIRTLTASEEVKYGVSHHDRLTSGVQFRNDKAQKLTQAKSNIQSQKLAAALTELDIPPRLFMPTERVCKEFEKLIHQVNLLLDTRKFAEKVEGEIRVLEAGKAERERKENEKASASAEGDEGAEDAPATANTSDPAATSGTKEGAEAEAKSASPGPAKAASAKAGKVTDGADAAAGSPMKGSGATHKRSASVLSVVSDKSTKKQKR